MKCSRPGGKTVKSDDHDYDDEEEDEEDDDDTFQCAVLNIQLSICHAL